MFIFNARPLFNFLSFHIIYSSLLLQYYWFF